jgi:thioredoxin-dependent peroxiredoxin
MKKTFVLFGLFGLFFGCGGARRPDGGTGLLPVGSAAPDLTGTDQLGQTHTLAETRGAYTLVYFYPKDATPGCTKEACAFRDVWNRYEAAGIKLFGVSDGTPESHKKFADKHTLPFPLIADTDKAWGAAFGVKSAMGMYQRVSFLLDKDGKVVKVYENVDPGVHATNVLNDIASMSGAAAAPTNS